ncbi:unnamed protein product [Miscanthus lutarioriparius]|uniref:Glyceraldehyde 3-phosphate dehydrogenase NAD(P) binding domain-containing protein n=1 Tax=Miscanthus lutarioriparius TaxID=422564 RepID=A0A811S0V3_9POAL|nr:unnamed protein product [Miscanthus lutarioriparius]
MASLSVSLRASASPAAGGAAGSRHADPPKVSCVRSKISCSFPAIGASSSHARSVEPIRATATQTPTVTPQSSSGQKIKVGINGFGRIGGLVLRIATSRDDIEVVSVNDPFIDAKYMAYMFKYDSTHGPFKGSIKVVNASTLEINGKQISVTSKRRCKSFVLNVHWDKATAIHIGCKFVTQEIPQTSVGVVMELNMLLNRLDFYNNRESISTFEATQKTVDGPSMKDWRGGHGPGQNVIPSFTGAAKVYLNSKEETGNFLCTDFLCSISLLSSRLLGRAASEGAQKGILGYTDEDVVSNDFVGDASNRVLDLIGHMALVNSKH